MILDLASTAMHPLLLGMNWMDPNWLLDKFGSAFMGLSLLIVFAECGLFFPFLPGDTLLVSVGLFIASSRLHDNLFLAILGFSVAAFLGNIVGYEIGRLLGPPLMHRDGRILKKRYFDETHEFFEKHGSQALVIGRFVPFVRTYITVVAGITQMERKRFLIWSALGAVAWVVIITMLGYFLGRSFPTLVKNIDLLILGILLLSALPVVYEWFKRRRHRESPAVRPVTPGSDVEV